MDQVSYTIIIAFIIFFILAFMTYRSLRRHQSVSLKTIVVVLLLIVIMMTRSLFIANFPNAYTGYTIDDWYFEYNPEHSSPITTIRSIIQIDEIGRVYLSGMDRQYGQLRLFIRLPGMSGNDITEADMNLVDDEGNVYIKSGGAFNGAILMSAASIDFVREDGRLEVGKEFVLTINGKALTIQ